jgi:hypothetical protein
MGFILQGCLTLQCQEFSPTSWLISVAIVTWGVKRRLCHFFDSGLFVEIIFSFWLTPLNKKSVVLSQRLPLMTHPKYLFDHWCRWNEELWHEICEWLFTCFQCNDLDSNLITVAYWRVRPITISKELESAGFCWPFNSLCFGSSLGRIFVLRRNHNFADCLTKSHLWKVNAQRGMFFQLWLWTHLVLTNSSKASKKV